MLPSAAVGDEIGKSGVLIMGGLTERSSCTEVTEARSPSNGSWESL